MYMYFLYHSCNLKKPFVQMPEEESFCVLVKIMFDYNMREMFKSGFEELHLSFYVLDRLMEVRHVINDVFCCLVVTMLLYHTNRTRSNELFFVFQNLLPDLHKHFKQLNIETHMFSSQWFLTLFTAKFPLNMVYQVLDIFLCEVIFHGRPSIFVIGITEITS